MEKTSRVLYLWRREVEEQRERAADIRHRNEQLVYNILPPHVATHFMGLRRKKHEELYSQSYEEVGVLFASMPNYSGGNGRCLQQFRILIIRIYHDILPISRRGIRVKSDYTTYS